MNRMAAALLPIAALLPMLIAAPAKAVVLVKSATLEGVQFTYKVVLPPHFDAARAYPAVLAFAPGKQDMAMVDFTLEANYRAEAERRGYLVFLPATPDAGSLGAARDQAMPAFLAKLLGAYKIRDNKFNAAGMSNGGLSAFQLAARSPQYFVSVTGLPGFLQQPGDGALDALGKLCIHMFAGELDAGWPEQSRAQATTLRARGFHASFSLEKGEGHVMQTLAGPGAARLFDQFDAARRGECAR